MVSVINQQVTENNMAKKGYTIPGGGSNTIDKTTTIRPPALPQPNVENPVRPTNRDNPTQGGPGLAQ